MNMNQQEQIIERIHAHGRFSGAPTLRRIRALMDALGNPQNTLKFVHIAGTNGKGSTAMMTATALEQAGFTTGLFVSPYVLGFRERIQINRTWISGDDLCRYAARVLAAEETLTFPEGEHIGEFEFTTAMALLYFAEQHCDIVVLEVGLGGRYDATNVIAAPEVAVMTHVALDHMAVLGNTVEEIAADKSHIVKPDTVLVSAPGQTDGVLRVLRHRCEEVGAEFAKSAQPEQILCSFSGGTAICEGVELHTKMIGKHQLYNLSTAYEVLHQLKKQGWNLAEEDIQSGLAQAVMPARQELVSEEPLILLDGSHNMDGVRALCNTLDTMLPPGGISMIVGMVSDKQVQECVKMLTRRADAIYAVAPDTPRAVPSSEICTIVRAFSPYTNTVDCGDVKTALRYARRMMTEDDVLVICGSLYVAAEAENLLRPDTI